MIRDCLELNLPDPWTSTYGATCAQIIVTDQEIKRLSKDASALIQRHLHQLIETVKSNNDHVCAKAITEMMKREDQKGRWAQTNHVTWPPRGGNPLVIQVMTPNGVELHNTEDLVFQHATAHLSLRFQLAYTAPCYSSHFLHDIGHLSNTQCTLEILEGTYTFPPDTDGWTRMILEEAHHTYTILAQGKIKTTISVRNYQNYWQSANKKTSSSFSRVHFGQY